MSNIVQFYELLDVRLTIFSELLEIMNRDAASNDIQCLRGFLSDHF